MPPFDYDQDGEIDYFSPGAYFGGALVDYTPGQTVPFDTDGDGEPNTEAEFRAWLASDSHPDDADIVAGQHFFSEAELSPLLRDDDDDGDVFDSYLGKPSPDWSGSFGATITMWNNFDLNTLFDRLDEKGIRVTSLRNKANRLEELFMGLVENKAAASGGAAQ